MNDPSKEQRLSGAEAEKGHVPYLDGWRGLAVIGVFFDHFLPNPYLNLGHLGVEMFFVLSGRLMAEILFVRKMPLTLFFSRRFSRIFPALLVFVAVMGIVSAWWQLSGKQGRAPVDGVDVLAALAFFTNYLFVFSGKASALSHTWSLSVEEHSYILLAVLAGVMASRMNRVAKVIVLVAVLCWINGVINSFVFGEDDHTVYWRTDVRIASVFGSAAVFLFLVLNQRFFIRSFAVLVCLAGAVVLSLDVLPGWIRYGPATLLLAIALNGISTGPAWVRNVLECRPLTYAGVLSYSLYLWQQPWSIAYARLGDTGIVRFILCLFGAVTLALVSYYFVERPMRRTLNGWFLGKIKQREGVQIRQIA